MKIVIIQNQPVFGEKTANIARVLELIHANSADLYVLPELFASGYNFSSQDEVIALSEPFGWGETYNSLYKTCRKNGCHIIYGFPENDYGHIYNSAGLIGPGGAIGLYRKIHLYYREKLFFSPGNLPFTVYDLPFGRVGIMICFDWYFPESARVLALRGAQLIAHPSNLVGAHCPDSMPVRARENGIFIATADRVGVENRGGVPLRFIGQSQLVAPDGSVIIRAGQNSEQVISLDIDLTEADNKSVTEFNAIFNDRRPEFY